MGCDIHLYVEKKLGNTWISLDKWKPSEYDDAETVNYHDRFYTGRNYRLFGALANVRNGWGFAGCDTGDAVKPISPPKGLPADVSELVEHESDNWGPDGHSHSWLTVKELDAYDWSCPIVIRGYVTKEQYEKFRDLKELPQEWSGMCMGPNIRALDAVDFELLSRQGKLDPNLDYRIQISWTKKLSDQCKEFLEQTMPKLRSFGDPEEVRIVFWFDN